MNNITDILLQALSSNEFIFLGSLAFLMAVILFVKDEHKVNKEINKQLKDYESKNNNT